MSTKETETGVRVAVDVGGTFTDVFVLDADGIHMSRRRHRRPTQWTASSRVLRLLELIGKT